MIGQMLLETPARIEPARLEHATERIADVVADIAAAGANLGRALHPATAGELAGLVRIMNTYYSNRIEGHDTRPRDIERALANDLDASGERRDLQREAASHVRVQAEIDRMAAEGTLPEPASRDFLIWLHREFYRDAPESMLRVRGRHLEFQMTPGAWRTGTGQDVIVGRHIPPASDRVPDFMAYFESRYRLKPQGAAARILSIAAAHHRFNFIHPFPDGNGRVSRLMSHAMAAKAKVGAHGLWSISRGLARGLESRADYMRMMDHADSPRQGDLDGRGNLSERALEEFVYWFLRVAIDQINFMASLFDINTLAGRLEKFVANTASLRPEAAKLLVEVLVRGEVERGEAPRITGLPERSARRVLKDTIGTGLLASATEKGPVSLRFPTATLEILFPRLYPET